MHEYIQITCTIQIMNEFATLHLSAGPKITVQNSCHNINKFNNSMGPDRTYHKCIFSKNV